MVSPNNRIGKILEKMESGQPLSESDTGLGVGIILRAHFEKHRELYAKQLAFKHGIWHQDVYDDFMNTEIEKTEKPIKIMIPNLFTWKEQNDQFINDLNRKIKYRCDHCKADIMRYPESRGNCPLCGAPYNYDIKKTFKNIDEVEEF